MHLGQEARINAKGWARYEAEGNRPLLCKDAVQVISALPLDGPYGDKVLLSFPFFWLNEDEIDLLG